MNNYTKLLADLRDFVYTLINSKQSIGYNEVSSALVNHKLRRKDKKSFKSTSTEALIIRGRSFSPEGKRDHGRSNPEPILEI